MSECFTPVQGVNSSLASHLSFSQMRRRGGGGGPFQTLDMYLYRHVLLFGRSRTKQCQLSSSRSDPAPIRGNKLGRSDVGEDPRPAL